MTSSNAEAEQADGRMKETEKELIPAKAKEIHPEQVIPMEDSDFKDF